MAISGSNFSIPAHWGTVGDVVARIFRGCFSFSSSCFFCRSRFDDGKVSDHFTALQDR